MIGPEDRYDVAHFEFIMRSARRLMVAHPELAEYISVSLHCEFADILNAYTKLVERDGKLEGPRRVQRRAAAALRGARGLDRRLPRLRDRLPQHQPAAPLVEEGDGRRADDAGSLPAHQLQARGDRRPSPARHRLCVRRLRQGEPADPPARRRGVAVAGGARAGRGLDRERPRVLRDRAEVQREVPAEHLARQVGIRRDRVPALRRAERGVEARHVLQPHGGAPRLESGAALRRPAEGRHRARLRRRSRARGSARVVRRASGRVGVEAGLHAVRGDGADRPGEEHVPPRRADLRPRATSSARRAAATSGAPRKVSPNEHLVGRALRHAAGRRRQAGRVRARCRAQAADRARARQPGAEDDRADDRGRRRRAPRRCAPRRPARRAAPAVERRRELHQHALARRRMPRPAADAGDDARRMGRIQSVAGDDGPGDAGGARSDGDDRAARRRAGADRRDGARRVGARVRLRTHGRGADRPARDRREGVPK